MAMRLTAEQALNVTRAFVQLQRPGKVEGDDYRISSSARFRKWRRFLWPICHYLSLSVIKLATKNPRVSRRDYQTRHLQIQILK